MTKKKKNAAALAAGKGNPFETLKGSPPALMGKYRWFLMRAVPRRDRWMRVERRGRNIFKWSWNKQRHPKI